MTNERRVLAVPSTEDPTSPLNHRQRLADDYLEKALSVVKITMESADEKLRWDAAKWVAEMVMGKPKQEIEQSGGIEAEMARMLASAYAEHLQVQAALPPAIEDGVYVLGSPPDTNDSIIPPERIIDFVEKRSSFDWDELPS